MQSKFIIGNWKENPENLETAKKIIQISEKFPFWLTHAVPSIFAGLLKEADPKANIILQDISAFESGSHTGEISAKQAKSIGVNVSLVGHSETRLSPNNPHGDEDIQVNAKIKNLLSEDMRAVLCVGEFIRDEKYSQVISTQLDNCLKDLSKEMLARVAIAYEPVWAIGKDAARVATDSEVIETISLIKNYMKKKYGDIDVKVLYGGSVDENNAKEIVNLEGVDGLLIGRASSDEAKWEKLLTSLTEKNKYKGIEDLNIQSGTRVLLRLDLNVPMDDKGNITNDFRITESIPTILKLQNLNARITILAHREEGSLSKVGEYLQKKINNFKFVPQTMPTELQNGEVLLLENVRSDKREKDKKVEIRDEIGKEWASYGDVYINEAFSASHRDHASITSIPKFLPSALGPKFINEVKNLSLALNPEHPSLLIVGGAKFDTKLPMIEKFLNLSDKIFVAGALAHSFWKSKRYELGTSLVDEDVKLSDRVLNSEKILLPLDVMIEDRSTKSPDKVAKEEKIVDFGPETLKEILKIANASKTIVWNGPVDFYENGYDWGTKELIENFSKMTDKTIILGGGDTVTEIDKVKEANPNIHFTHVSTGGGAMIDFLSNGTLPGIEAIK